jgi:hypothetical protein
MIPVPQMKYPVTLGLMKIFGMLRKLFEHSRRKASNAVKVALQNRKHVAFKFAEILPDMC